MLKKLIQRKKSQTSDQKTQSSQQKPPKQRLKPQKIQYQSQQQTQQMIDSLINIDNQLKIVKNTPQLLNVYPTLSYINKILCEDNIDVYAIKLFLKNKCNQTYNFKDISIKKNLSEYAGNVQSNGLIYQFYSIRALLWKIALRYLPSSKNKWISYMQGKMIEYHEQIKEHILDIIVKKKKKQISHDSIQKIGVQSQEKRQASDHPLNLGKQSKWKTFFDDRELWNIVQKDTMRTKPNCLFFRLEYQIQFLDEPLLNKYNIKKAQIHLSKQINKEKTYYYDSLTRIIYIYLKRNPEVQYCQGMNQLAALIFYSFANKNSQYFRRVAQSDSYFCFEKIMSQLLKQNPSSVFFNGQKYYLKFQQLLKKIDLRLYQKLCQIPQHLSNLKIISIKWFNSLFLNEYEIDDNLILYDIFMANINKNELNQGMTISNLVICLALGIVHLYRNELDGGQNPIILFQKIKQEPSVICEKGMSLYKIFHQYFI